ncbi:uncharacterized protein PGTG_04263 [Puccinia graminis f. sp. tritici CRL 75-36-700-3]|uniref:Uncharacterized protein n=1 Tax=Puccinia graminis f. sp. tritici (strain CRL 75-36-700-3 / race SCCL) TaxID=418459 RepID=E3K2Y7_PUCGT|nr:uncharacterized protein PGTG_04263 [Puccinia graminis f. sp. tritici CRL 75-36-700-3]EFP78307.1 hypothetical protein PGTG_04263 [Puccinia graminis f. sp. tritici CRL 75-36-700-3]
MSFFHLLFLLLGVQKLVAPPSLGSDWYQLEMENLINDSQFTESSNKAQSGASNKHAELCMGGPSFASTAENSQGKVDQFLIPELDPTDASSNDSLLEILDNFFNNHENLSALSQGPKQESEYLPPCMQNPEREDKMTEQYLSSDNREVFNTETLIKNFRDLHLSLHETHSTLWKQLNTNHLSTKDSDFQEIMHWLFGEVFNPKTKIPLMGRTQVKILDEVKFSPVQFGVMKLLEEPESLEELSLEIVRIWFQMHSDKWEDGNNNSSCDISNNLTKQDTSISLGKMKGLEAVKSKMPFANDSTHKIINFTHCGAFKKVWKKQFRI